MVESKRAVSFSIGGALALISVLLVGAIMVAAEDNKVHKDVLFSKDPLALAIAAGNHYAKLQEYEKALEYFDLALEIDGKNAQAWHNKGFVLSALGDEERAMVAMRQAVDSDPSYAKAHYGLGLLLYHQGEFAEAYGHLESAARLYENNANAWFDAGVSAVAQFREMEGAGMITQESLVLLIKAQEAYNYALQIDSSFPHAKENARIVGEVRAGYGA